MHVHTPIRSELRTGPMGALLRPHSPIRVFLISDFQLFVDALSGAIHQRPERFVLKGVASALAADPPWNGSAPDVAVLDVDQDPDTALSWLSRHRGLLKPRWLLVSRNRPNGHGHDDARFDHYGVLGRHHSLEQMLQAIEQVHDGHSVDEPPPVLATDPEREGDDESDDVAPVVRLLLTLTSKERRILTSLLRSGGDPAKVIADKMFISESTLRSHLTSIYQKMGVRNRIGLVSQAAKTGLASHLSSLEPAPGRRDPLSAYPVPAAARAL